MLILLLRTFLIYMLILFLMRLMGKRHLGELQPSELVSTILISNLASISIESPEIPLAASLAPVLLIVVLELLFSALCFKSPKASKLVSGKPMLVIRNGQINQEALFELRLSIKDLMAALRAKDVFDPTEVQYALMETSGSLSVCRAAAVSVRAGSTIRLPFIVDGEIQEENLRMCRKDRRWLANVLSTNGCAPKQILLLLGDESESVRLIKKENR